MKPTARLSTVIEFLKDKHGLTNEDLSLSLGYRTKNYVSDIIGGNKLVNRLFLDKLKTYFSVNPEYILDGKGEMLVDKFDSKFSREIRAEEQEAPYSVKSGSLAGRDFLNSRREHKNSTVPFTAPMVPAKARAGYVKSYDQVDFLDTLEKYALPPGISHIGAVWRYFEVGGDSMEPTLHSGDIVLASQVPQEDWAQLRNFYIYVIVTEKDMWIKRIYAEKGDDWV